MQESIRLTHGVATGPSRLVGKGGARVAGYDVPAKVIRLLALRNAFPLSDHIHYHLGRRRSPVLLCPHGPRGVSESRKVRTRQMGR